MPIKGIIAVFMIALAISVVCWKDIREDLLQLFEEDDNNKEENQ